ncbi:MAG: TIGR01777 family oxidoreductase [Thaumarchaeota archaeon]|nr:TIGR01777 family oxidoreductase [Nitrososphaerota archaeon]
MGKFSTRTRTDSPLESVQPTLNNQPRKILITGSTGFIGSQLIPFLTAGGHTVIPMFRSNGKDDKEDAIYWDPAEGTIDSSKLEGMDVVIHLSGASIANGRWSEERKGIISRSRVDSTVLLSHALSKLRKPPEVLVSASATGYYGDTGKKIITERSAPGSGFLPTVSQEWERSTKPASNAGIRVVNLRTGLVLSPLGGFLKQILPLFRLGLGGKLGSGKQYMSWISMDDLLHVVLFAITNKLVKGPINVTSPKPVTNEKFTKTLGHVLSRPTLFSVPASAIRLLFGEMGKDLVLGGCRVIPEKILTLGFRFSHPTLEKALKHVLGK